MRLQQAGGGGDAAGRRPEGLIGRRAQLEEVRAAVRSRPGHVAIVGEAGVGKSRLAAAAADHLGAEGWNVERVFAGPTLRPVPLGAMVPVVGATIVDAEGPAEAFWRTAVELRRRCRRQPTVLVVDDAHHLDELSAGLVAQLAASTDVSIVLARRSDESLPDDLDSVEQRARARIDLAPLDEPATRALAESLLDGPVAPPLGARLWRLTAGNPLFVREAVLGGLERDILARGADGRWTLDGELADAPRLVDLIERRLADLDDDERLALDAVALMEPLPAPVLDQTAGDRALSGLEDRALVTSRDAGDTVWISLDHPLTGEVRRAAMSPARRRSVAAALTRAFSDDGADDIDVIRLAELQIAGGRVTPRVCEQAAVEALRRGDSALALRLADAAVEAGAGFLAALTRASALGATRDDHGARTAFAELDAAAAADREVADAARAHAYFLFEHALDPDQARAVLAGARDRLGPGELADELTGFELELLHETTDLAQVRLAVRPLLGRATAPPVRARVLSMASLTESWFGEPGEGLACADESLRLARELAADPALAPLSYFTQIGCLYLRPWALLLLGRGDEALAHVAEAQASPLAEMVGPAGVLLAANAGWTHLVRGEIDPARELLEGGLRHGDDTGTALFRAETLMYLYLAAGLGGDVERCDQVAAEIAAIPLRNRRAIEIVRRLGQVAHLGAAGERTAAAEVARATLQDYPGYRTFEAWLWHDLARLDHAAEAAAALDRIVRSSPDLVLARMLAADARARGEGDGAALLEVADEFSAAGLHRHAGDAVSAAVGAYRAAGARGSALLAEERLPALAERCPGAALPEPADEASAQLTARQREVAGLAARGLANKEIAARLGVSVRTVENLLARVYRTLGISGRSGLC